MRKTMLREKVHIVIFAIFFCSILSACRYGAPEESYAEIVSDIAAVVKDNYTSEDAETPLMISITEIEELTDNDSELYKAIEEYDDVKQYKVYLLDNDMVLVVTDVIFQGVKGFVVSDEELDGTLTVPGLGFDGDRVSIINRIEDSNIYYFSAGL